MSQADATPRTEPYRVLAGRYRLLFLIESGGMAEVWEGRDALLARPVAIKMPLAHLARQEQVMRRFRREAVAAARLSHPNVVAVYDTGTEGADSFIVMERVIGTSLRRLMEAECPMDVARAVAIATQVAEALDFAHRAGVVHRDVKPANILVTPEGIVKVTDFGIAKAMQEEDATRTNGTFGTARYIAPEQVEGGTPDGRADVYALGVVLYEMVCGRPPFRADSDVALALQHLREPPPSPSQLRPDVPSWLEAVVLRALAKDPSQRFGSAGEMAATLRRGFEGPPPPLAGWRSSSPANSPARGRWGGSVDTTASLAAGALITSKLAGVRTSDLGGAAESAGPTPPAGRLGAPPERAVPAAPRGSSARPPARRPTSDGSGRAGVHRAQRRRVPWLVGLVVVAALVVVGVVASQGVGGGTARRQTPGSSSGSGRSQTASAGVHSLPIAGGVSYDPEGDGSEDPAQVPNLYDGNPATAWHTDRYYGSRRFGNLKSGVGFVLELAQPAPLDTLQVLTSTPGWQASIYLSNHVSPQLDGWGTPVIQGTATGHQVSFDLGGHRARDVLVWFTLLSPNNQIWIQEVSLRGR